MITVDISNIWCSVSLQEVLSREQHLNDAHLALTGGEYRQNCFLGWVMPPDGNQKTLMREISGMAARIAANSRVLVVVGTGALCGGARGVQRLVSGRRAQSPQCLFVGDSLSPEDWVEVTSILENTDFSVLVTTPAGSETAPLVLFRALRWIMEKRYGEGTKERIFVAPGAVKSVLTKVAREEGYALLLPPTEPGAAMSMLTPAGLLLLAVAGRSPGLLWDGAVEMRTICDGRSLENPAWLYAAARAALLQKGFSGELLCTTDPRAAELGQWWSRVLMAACGKDGMGTAVLPVRLPGDFRIFGDYLLSCGKKQFATMFSLPESGRKVTVEMAWRDVDGLNTLAGKDFSALEEQTMASIREAMSDASVPYLQVSCEEPLTDDKLGELLYFAEFSAGLSARVLGADPVKQSGSDAVWEALQKKFINL